MQVNQCSMLIISIDEKNSKSILSRVTAWFIMISHFAKAFLTIFDTRGEYRQRFKKNAAKLVVKIRWW